MSVLGIVSGAAVTSWAVVLSAVDLRCRRLPNPLTLTGGALILLGAVVGGRGGPALLGAAALGGLYLAVHLADPTALGGGDVKLAFALGALTGAFGPPVWVLGALGAPILTACAGLWVMLRHGLGANVAVPHGPSMCAASLVAAAFTAC